MPALKKYNVYDCLHRKVLGAVVQRLDNPIHHINGYHVTSVNKTNHCWIMIYLVDRDIHLLNNPALYGKILTKTEAIRLLGLSQDYLAM